MLYDCYAFALIKAGIAVNTPFYCKRNGNSPRQSIADCLQKYDFRPNVTEFV